jgi:hypothetical protein
MDFKIIHHHIFKKDLNMRILPFVILGYSVLMFGCTDNNDDLKQQVIDQQKIIENLKHNQISLENINQKEKGIAKREKEIRDSLNKIEAKKKELAALESKLNDYSKELATRETNVKELLEQEKKAAEDAIKQNEIAEKRSETAVKRTLYLEELSRDWAKAAQSGLHLPEALEIELEKELDVAFSQNKGNAYTASIYNKYNEMERTLWYNNIQAYLQQNDVINIKSDVEFESTANDLVERFVKNNTSSDDYDKIQKGYLKIKSERK